MVNHTQTIRRLLLKNSFSKFDHFVGLALKGFKDLRQISWRFIISFENYYPKASLRKNEDGVKNYQNCPFSTLMSYETQQDVVLMKVLTHFGEALKS